MNCYSSGRVHHQLERSFEPHHLREAIKMAGDEISEPWFLKALCARARHLVENATSRSTIELIDEILESLETEITRRYQLRLILIELLVEESKPKVITYVSADAEESELDGYYGEELELMKQKTNYFFRDADLGQSDLVKKVEKELILTMLKIHEFNRTRTAKALGVSIRTLRNKLYIYLGKNVDDEEIPETLH